MDNGPVVAGTDGSEASMRAIEWAAREAVARRRPLRIVSVPVTPRFWQRTPPGRPDTVADLLCAAAEESLAVAAARAAETEPGLDVSTARLSGLPAQALAEAAIGASMLVVGSRGGGGLAALMLGSVSRHVAFAATCPVVVTTEEAMAVHRQVVVGVHEAGRPAALRFAFEEASGRQARLQVIHAWEVFLPSALLIGAGWPGGAHEITAEATTWLAALTAPWRNRFPDVKVVEDVVNGSPGRTLVDASARADLVVIGRSSQVGSTTSGTGTVTHAVLNHAHCPIAIIPE
jgi:nucleotide-binding universal stress UspA family protein